MTLVSGHMRCVRIFVGVPLGWASSDSVGLSMTVIFDDLGGYFFGNIRDKASSITW